MHKQDEDPADRDDRLYQWNKDMEAEARALVDAQRRYISEERHLIRGEE